MQLAVFPIALLIALPSTWASAPAIEPTCDGDDYINHSKELKKLYEEDQAERADFTHADENRLVAMLKHDRVRRIRVAEIFAKGCLKSAEDYLNAATIFQHGEVPDHFYQTYLWAKKAFDMGLEEAGAMAANGIDRYLMNTGRNQLYGGQAITEPGKPNRDRPCFCLWPIESSFSDTQRKALKFRTQTQIQEWLKDMNKDRKGCSNAVCKIDAKAVPRGSLPGVW